MIPKPLCTVTLLTLMSALPVVNAGAQSESSDEAVKLSPFVVDSSQDVGYKATNTISGTRTNIPIMDVPMNIAVVTSEMLTDLAVNTPTEALRYFGSASNTRQTARNQGAVDLDASAALFGSISLRGLTVSNNLRNGVRSLTQQPSEFIDRVELVRGPAAVLYGLSEPTGIYNVISKSPDFNRSFSQVQGRYGSYDTYSGSLDVNYALNDKYAVRLNMMGAHYDTEYWFNEGDAFAFMPQLSWRPFENTEVKFEYYDFSSRRARPDQRHTYLGTSGNVLTTPNYPTLVPGMDIPMYEDSRYDIDPRYSFSGPDSYRDVDEKTVSLTVNQQVGEHLNLSFQAQALEREIFQHFANIALIQGHNTFWYDSDILESFQLRRWDDQRTQDWAQTFVGTAVYQRDYELPAIGETSQTFSVGLQGYYSDSYKRQWADQRDLRQRDAQGNVLVAPYIPPGVATSGRNAAVRANYPSLNGGLFDPRTSRPPPGVWFDYLPVNMNEANTVRPDDVIMTLLPPGTGTFTSLANANRSADDFTSVWAQWNGKFLEDRVILSAGVFRTEIEQETGNSVATLSPFYDSGATLPQYGLIVRPFSPKWGTISLFALYSESLQPNTNLRDGNNEPFDPRFGKGSELGIKFDLAEGRISGTISRWDIDQTNRVVFDPNAPNNNTASGMGANVARGLNTSQGWEADVIVSWSNQWQTMLSYANMDVFASNDPNPLLDGADEIGSYDYGFGILTSYRFVSDALKGLMIGVGANYKSEEIAESKRAGFNGERQRVYPAIWDGNAFVSYHTKLFGYDTRWQVNVTNLFREERPVGWDPAKINDLGYANEPFLYPTVRKVTLTATFEF